MNPPFSLLWLLPALPLAGFLVLSIFGRSLPRRLAAAVGVGSVGLSAALAGWLGFSFFGGQPAEGFHRLELGSWFDAGSLQIDFALRLDALSMLMVLVITGVGFLIHLYSAEYMADDPSYARFFANMNLFVAAMLMLVLGDNLLLLFLGWEGVGLASYLLIGFWYQEAKNAQAAMKAFVVTRIGDAGLALGILLIFTKLGTLEIAEAVRRATEIWPVGSSVAFWAALLLLCGAIGKSGQVPLQVWLPDAMAGPTPVSALIHAATMVTAGVYLIARTHGIFQLAPQVMSMVVWVGVATLLVGGVCALAQRDLKRILAYSTISQIGYMFLALGVGAWSAAMFHFMTHAFFKALLFLAAGWIIVALHHEQDVFKMGGLKNKLPIAWWSFLVGGASLAALPFLGSGFFSKEQILSAVWSSPLGGPIPWFLAVAGAFLTSVYTARMLMLVFFGEAKTEPHGHSGFAMKFPLQALIVLAFAGGWLWWPHLIAHIEKFPQAMASALPAPVFPELSGSLAWMLFLGAEMIVIGGLLYGIAVYRKRRGAPAEGRLARGLGFDATYDLLLVRPYRAIAGLVQRDPAEMLPGAAAALADTGNKVMSSAQDGRLRWYIGLLAGGAIFLLIVFFAGFLRG